MVLLTRNPGGEDGEYAVVIKTSDVLGLRCREVSGMDGSGDGGGDDDPTKNAVDDVVLAEIRRFLHSAHKGHADLCREVASQLAAKAIEERINSNPGYMN